MLISSGSDDGVLHVGTFRHDACDWVSHDGHPFPELMCNACASIPNAVDFKRRLVRREADTHTHCVAQGRGARFDYMPRADLLFAARRLRDQCSSLRRRHFWVCAKLVAARAKVRTWRDRAREGALRGDLKKVVDDLTAAFDAGKFTEKRALWNFLKDIVHSVHIGNDDGSRSRGMRWSSSTHRIFAVLRKVGGPRTHKFLYDNVGGPS